MSAELTQQSHESLGDRLDGARRQLRQTRHNASIAALAFTGLGVETGFLLAGQLTQSDKINHNLITDWKFCLGAAVINALAASNCVNQILRCVNLGSEVGALSVAQATQADFPQTVPEQTTH
jgi:hypothetical protein